MASFFKSFGKGLLYILALPLILVVLVVYGVYGILVFIFMLFRNLIMFFTGRKIFDDLPEDKKAKEIMEAKLKAVTEPAHEVLPQQQSTTINNIYQSANPQPGTITVTIPLTPEMLAKQNKSPIEIAREEAQQLEVKPNYIEQQPIESHDEDYYDVDFDMNEEMEENNDD